MSAKDIILKPITSQEANAVIKRLHYSGRVVMNSQVHLGVFFNGRLEGAMQFGPSLDKSKLIGLVANTKWNEFIELNRMAFSDALPRNSESRAISIAMRLMKRYAPHIKWVVSFADATQCGDGTIYRASGFVLTGIKQNGSIYQLPALEEINWAVCDRYGVSPHEVQALKNWLQTKIPRGKRTPIIQRMAMENSGNQEINSIMRKFSGGKTRSNYMAKSLGGELVGGYQLRYIYFIDKASRSLLTVPEIPFGRIDELSAGMYLGQRKQAVVSLGNEDDDQSYKGGSTPTPPLNLEESDQWQDDQAN